MSILYGRPSEALYATVSLPTGPVILIRLPQLGSSVCRRSATICVKASTLIPESGYPVSLATCCTTTNLFGGGQQPGAGEFVFPDESGGDVGVSAAGVVNDAALDQSPRTWPSLASTMTRLRQ